MGSLEVVLIGNGILILILLVVLWKDVLQMIQPSMFYSACITMKDGEKKLIWALKNPNGEINHKKYIYYIVETKHSRKGSKHFDYDEGKPMPKTEELTVDTKLDLELEKEEVKTFNIFKEKKSLSDILMQYVLPALIGLIIGALAMTVHWQSQCNIQVV